MNRKLSIFRNIHRITVGIGFVSILLPILFWEKIPNQIPSHYNGAGVVDAWSDKISLVLLFVLILVLLGAMSITVYYLRSVGSSPNADESEKNNLHTLYPAIVIMNLFLQMSFTYIVLCSVLGRNLGVLFTPVMLVGTFTPLVWFFYQNTKKSASSKEMKSTYEKQERDALQEGKRYWTGMDIGILILIPVGELVRIIVESFRKGNPDWLCIGILFFVSLIFVPLLFMHYTLYEDHLLVDCIIFGKERIPYECIIKIRKTYNPLASAALSIRRVQIDYMRNQSHQMILISPWRRQEFIREVKKRISDKKIAG